LKYSYNYETLFGNLTIVTDNEFLVGIIFGKENIGIVKETSLIKEIKKQIDEYLIGSRKKFDVPIKMLGTDFQIKVWEELAKIEYGECISYQTLAERVRNKNYARAVGMANNKNPIPIIIPCHRVIGKNGDLVGYGGGIDIKIKLLEVENYKRKIFK
jgi:methylated-DNA-[protein]-cysteine S-methyltransferase